MRLDRGLHRSGLVDPPRGGDRLVLVALRAGADVAAAERRAAGLPPLAIVRVRAYWYSRTGSAVVWIRLAAVSSDELAAIHALADGRGIEVLEPDRWPHARREVLVRRLMPMLDHAGDHASIADALRAVAAPELPRARVRHATGNRMIAGAIYDASEPRSAA
jgi:hypothetical protein